MPTYVYKFIASGETIEVQQAFTDDTLTEYTHPGSGELLPVKKVFQPVGVTFKGSGFFKTDNRGSQASTPPGASSDSSNSSNGADSSSSSKESSGSTSSKESSASTSSSDSSSSSSSSSTTTTKTKSSSD